jgi:hypothetical protein
MVKFLCMILLAFLSRGLFSYSFAQQDAKLKKLATDADVIVTGKVAGQKSSWDNNKTRIYTEATLQVDEFLKGSNNGTSVVVTYPGGEVNGVGELYTHMPKFEKDEDVLVFLKRDEKNMGYRVFDGEEGKLKIIKDKNTGERITTSNVRVEDLKSQIKKYLTK